MPKSPDSLLAIFSNDRPSEEHLEELGADDILEEVEPIEIEAEASDADATLPPKDAPKVEVKAEAKPEPQPDPKVEAKVEAKVEPKVEPKVETKPLVAPVAAPVIVEAPAASDPEMGEPTIVLERKSMEEAEKRSEPIADRTMRMPRSDAFQAARILASVPPAPTTQPVLPSAAPTPRRPLSIAPVALDVANVQSLPPRATGQKPSGLAIGLAAAAVVLLAGSITTGVLIGRKPAAAVSTASTATTTTTAEPAAEPKTASVEAAGTAEINANPATATAKDTAHANDPAELPSADVSSLPSVAPAAAKPAAVSHAQPAAQPAEKPASHVAERPAPAEKPAQPAPQAAAPRAAAATGIAPSSGVIRVPVSDSIITIKVDGSYRRVKNGAVVVGCGHHTVQVATGVMKEVDVPCGGAVFVE